MIKKSKAAKKAANKARAASADTTSVSGRLLKQSGGKMSAQVKGAQFGESVLGEEGLGRMGEDTTLQAMEAQAAELAKGFSSEEMQARQERGVEGIIGSTAAQSRQAQAAMARSGVKGQAAGAQLSNIAQSGVEARGNLERDLITQQREAQMQGLQVQSGIHSQTISSQQFDLSQQAKEKNIALQAGLGFMQMDTAAKTAKIQGKYAKKAAKAGKSSCFIEGTQIRMMDDSLKNIEDIQLADFVSEGGVVYSISKALISEIYQYNGVVVAGGHAVLENDVWIRVEDSKRATKFEGIFPVYNLCTQEHLIITENGTTFADFDETDLASKISDKESLEALNGEGSKVLETGRRV